MADRYFKDHVQTMEQSITKLYNRITTDGSGNVDTQEIAGFRVLSGAAAGELTIEFGAFLDTVWKPDLYPKVKMIQGMSGDAIGNIRLGSNTIATNGQVQIFLTNAAGTDADLVSGTLYLEVTVKNSGVTI